jgi:hypothetical protein
VAVQGIISDDWRTVLARVHSRDVLDVHADIVRYKIGEGGFVDVPPKQPVAPVSTRTDLESEGAELAGGGTAVFTNGSDVVTGTATTFLADLVAGQWIKPGPTFLVEGLSFGSSGDPGSERDEWAEILSVDNDLQVTLTANYAGATTLAGERAVRKADEPLFTFRKTLVAGDVTFFSALPAITEVDVIVLAGEANLDQLGNDPEFFELGMYDANGVMVAYVTFDLETKSAAVQLNHIIQVIW